MFQSVNLGLHGDAPSYISEILQPSVTSRTLSLTDQGLVSGPEARLKTTDDGSWPPDSLEIFDPPATVCGFRGLTAKSAEDCSRYCGSIFLVFKFLYLVLNYYISVRTNL